MKKNRFYVLGGLLLLAFAGFSFIGVQGLA